MLKRDFFLKAIVYGAHTKRAWLIALLAVTQEAPERWMVDSYPYRIVSTTSGYSFVDPENNNQLTPIDDGKVGAPLFVPLDGIMVPPGVVLNAPQGVDTTIGNVLFNAICMVPAFGRKFPFMTGYVDLFKVEAEIATKMKDDPWVKGPATSYREENDSTVTHNGTDYHLNTVFEDIERLKLRPQPVSTRSLEWILESGGIDETRVENANTNVPIIIADFEGKNAVIDGAHRLQKAVNTGQQSMMVYMVDDTILEHARNDKMIFVSEYLKFVDSFSYLTELNAIVTQGLTKKAITAPPGIAAFKKELFDKYKDSLTDPTTIALIEAELEKFDAAYIKGDDSENFLISGKSRRVVRKKLFLMYGAEAGLSGGRSMDLVKNSLQEGWEPEKFPAMNNASRAGSYFRGFETQKGGEEVKWLFRASSNVKIIDGDCKTPLGKAYTIDEENYKKLVSLNVITKDGYQLMENDAITKSLMGKDILVRDPMYCRLPFTDYCRVCMGERLSANKDAASMAITAEGSALMLLSMKAMHGKSLSLAKLNLVSAFS